MNAHISDAYKDLPNPYYIDPGYITDDPANPITPEGLAELSAKNRVFITNTVKEKGLDYLKTFLADPNSNPKLCVNKMKQAYMEDKDLYAMIAQSAFNNKYEDNLEFYPEGTELNIDGKIIIAGKKTHKNPAGKDRRSTGKVLNLASSYGMSGATAGARMNKSKEEGEALLDSFFRGFPAVDVAISESKKFLKKYGYVEDFYGRRRHLDEINLPAYEFKPLNNEQTFNPFLICNDPKPESKSMQTWKQIVAFYVYMSNTSRKASAFYNEMPYEPNDEMSNETYEILAKLAANPNLWDKPCITNDTLQLLIHKGSKSLKSYVLCKRNGKCNRDVTTTFDKKHGIYRTRAKGTPINYGTEDKPEYKILTNKEKLITDIYEFIEARQADEEAISNYLNIEPIPAPIISPEIELPKEPILIQANTGRRSQAERQCFNARIQGGAATLTKLAMIDIAADPIMKECKANLIIPVHDELLVECPAFYADKVLVRLPELMVGAAKKGGIDIPQKCDPYCVDRWYADEMAAVLTDEFSKLTKGDPKKGIAPKSKSEALKIIYDKHEEIPQASILDVIEGRTPDEVIF